MFGLIKAKAGSYILAVVLAGITFLIWEKLRLENKVAQIASESAVFEQAAIANETALMVYSKSVNEDLESYRIDNAVLSKAIIYNTDIEHLQTEGYNEVNLNEMDISAAVNHINSEYERLRVAIQEASNGNKGDRGQPEREATAAVTP